MRSPAERLRIERALRLLGLVALTVWILLALRPRAGRSERADARSLPQALERWTRSDPVASASVRLDTVPDMVHLAWLDALRRAGVPVHWTGASDPLAVESYASSDPSGSTVLLATEADKPLLLSDALGLLDSLDGGSVRVAAVEGDLDVRSGSQHARLVPPAPRGNHRVYIAGTADWESKFVVAALEESGWQVSARLVVGPGNEVTQGNLGTLDTARYAAVVLLDSASAERTRGVERFVRSGGGVLLAGNASRAQSVAPLTAWQSLAREVAPLGTSAEDSLWRGSSRVPFSVVANRALVLERREGNATLAARRHYAGRVAAVGYDQSWRWRMTGSGAAVAAHRDWWSRLVSSVAHRPPAASVGAAPLASLYQALGAPSEPSIAPDWAGWSALARLLGAMAVLALVSEWLLRRSRGGR